MRRATVADQPNPFEVFAGRELAVGRPLVARLVGRKFDNLFEQLAYDRPYDARFGKAMLKTLSYLVTTLGCTFGFAERTELSLYAVSNGGDARRLMSRIAGEASGKLSLLLSSVGTFEVHLYEFPEAEDALEYFRWRQEEAEVTAIDRYCMHVLSQSGADPDAATRILDGLGSDEKVELLRQNALDFSTVPTWQRNGAVVRLRAAPDQSGQSDANGTNARLLIDLNLPIQDEFGQYVRRALTQ
jgi:tRNA(His) 5'-end guanylyltransferase